MTSPSSSSSNFDLIFGSLDESPSGPSDPSPEESFTIIRNVLSMLNGLNVETMKKNPNDLFMQLKYHHQGGDSLGSLSSLGQLPDELCQLLLRIGGLGKLLLKMINYLNYYSTTRSGDALTRYPMFDNEGDAKSTLGNIKQYFVGSVQGHIQSYHYHLLLIEGKLRVTRRPFTFTLRRLLIWSDEWLEKFLFLVSLLKECLDLKGVSLLNAVHDASQHGSPLTRRVGRGVLHQALKPFIANLFDWLLSGEIPAEINVDFFIRVKEKETLLDLTPIRPSASTETLDPGETTASSSAPVDEFEWKLYRLNAYQVPSFLSRLTLKKVYFIGNAVRLLRYMLKEEYESRSVGDLLLHSPISLAYDAIKKFVYRNVDTFGRQETEEEPFFFEHPLVDEFDLLLDAYYAVLNEEMFKLLGMSGLASQFETQIGYVLMQRGDFYESLMEYLLPLLRKPATEVVNLVSPSCTSLHRILHMFLANAKLMDLAEVYKIDSLLYNNYDLSDSVAFTFTKTPPPLAHHLGWDVFLSRYTFTKKVYCVLFQATSPRYERLFRQLFGFKRVLFAIRKAQREVSYYLHRFGGASRRSRVKPDDASSCSKLTRTVLQLLRLLHFLLFHQFGFLSRLYAYFGSSIESSWSTGFHPEFTRRQSNIETFARAHERFLGSIETLLLFRHDTALLTAFAAVNGCVVDLCESFAEEELFPTLASLETLADDTEDGGDFEELQSVAESLFRHQFKVNIAISKYRCCLGHFIELAQESSFEFKYDVRNYGPCLDALFQCHNLKGKSAQT